jgi:tRNA/rRNA methyltransferase
VAFVFGSERFGMANEDVWRCHSVLSIPTHREYGSLNLAQAVQLIAYEWRQSLGGFPVIPATPPAEWADAAEVQGVLTHWRSALEAIGYLDPKAPKKLLPRLNQLANRLTLTRQEVHILRGVARAMQRAGQGGAPRDAGLWEDDPVKGAPDPCPADRPGDD